MTLRNMSPAPTSNRTARATWPTTSTCRMASLRRDPTPPRPASRSSVALPAPATRAAGASPHSTPVTADNPRVNARTRASTATSSRRGSVVGARATNARSPAHAATAPSVPPINASTTLSVSSSACRLPRPAPSAARNAISGSRAMARPSVRFATVAHASARTSPTPPRMSTSTRSTLPTMVSRNGTSFVLQPASSTGYARASDAAMLTISCSACARLTPTRNRPTTPR